MTLGLVPGAGGTQRLPRLIGAEPALDLIVFGRRINGSEALELGIVDAVVEPSNLVSAAREIALALGERKNPVDALQAPILPPEWADVRDRHLARARRRPAAIRAAELVEAAAHGAIANNLRAERRPFDMLRASEEAGALRHLFFSEREAARRPAVGTPRPVERAAVIGAGTMGAAIAALLSDRGIETTLVDRDQAALERADTRAQRSGRRMTCRPSLTPTS